MMHSLDYNFHRRLKQILIEQIRLGEQRLGEGSATTFDAYRHSVGRLSAFRDMLKLADELEAEMTGRKIEEN